MAQFAYAVDRRGELQAGDVIDLERHTDLDPPRLQTLVDSWFPDGVTRHGEQYLLQPAQATFFDPSIELTCELVRRAEFPDHPSRFASVFGCESEADARRFMADFAAHSPQAQILEVEADTEPFRADMRCLDVRGSILLTTYSATRYWRQEANDLNAFGFPPRPAFWELLLSPPVRVLREI